MSQARRMAALILLGVAMLVLALIVYIRNRGADNDLLATIGVLGGLAVVVVVLPGNGKKE
jgi:cyanate permease